MKYAISIKNAKVLSKALGRTVFNGIFLVFDAFPTLRKTFFRSLTFSNRFQTVTFSILATLLAATFLLIALAKVLLFPLYLKFMNACSTSSWIMSVDDLRFWMTMCVVIVSTSLYALRRLTSNLKTSCLNLTSAKADGAGKVSLHIRTPLLAPFNKFNFKDARAIRREALELIEILSNSNEVRQIEIHSPLMNPQQGNRVRNQLCKVLGASWVISSNPCQMEKLSELGYRFFVGLNEVQREEFAVQGGLQPPKILATRT